MNTKIKFIFTLIVASLAGQVFAAPVPPPVSGVTAQALDGQVIVQWDAIDSAMIDYYRVYYSTESILENNGIYDDFEVTDGNLTTLSFIPPRNTQDIYVAVIAVSGGGVESPYFIDEAYVKVPAGPAVLDPKDEPEPPEVRNPDVPAHTTLKLLKATVTTPEEIVAEFSTAVIVDPASAVHSLKVTKAGGYELVIRSIVIDDKTVIINTATQERGVVYNVQFAEPFAGRSGQSLDPDTRSVLVKGHASGKEPMRMEEATPPIIPSLPDMQEPAGPSEVLDADMQVTAQPDGNFTVTIPWTLPKRSDLWKVVVYQTRDGRTFGPATLLPLDIAGVQLQNVTPGFYGLYIQTVTRKGEVSPGVFVYATLGAGNSLRGQVGAMNNNQRVRMVSLDVIDGESEMKEMDFDNAQLKEAASPVLDWMDGLILAASIAATLSLLVGIFALCMRPTGSAE